MKDFYRYSGLQFNLEEVFWLEKDNRQVPRSTNVYRSRPARVCEECCLPMTTDSSATDPFRLGFRVFVRLRSRDKEVVGIHVRVVERGHDLKKSWSQRRSREE